MAPRTPSRQPETFSIPEEILAPRSRRAESNSRILQSPEVLHQIYRNLHRPADRVKFALSCKEFARMAKTIPLNTSIILSPKKGKIRAYTKADLKRDLACWHSLRRCRGCKKKLPKQRIWRMNRGVEITKLKNVDWLWAVKDWMGGGQLCPPCRIAEHYDSKASGWLQCRPEGFATVTMFQHLEEAK